MSAAQHRLQLTGGYWVPKMKWLAFRDILKKVLPCQNRPAAKLFRWAEGTHRKLTNDITKEAGPQVHHHTPRGDAHRLQPSAARPVGCIVCRACPSAIRIDAAG